MSKCRLFHDWRLGVAQHLTNNIGWLFLDCNRCGKSKNTITTQFWQDRTYYWNKESLSEWYLRCY